MTAATEVRWIESTSWELPFFGLPSRIPWPADVDEAEANKDPFEVEPLLRAIEALGESAAEPFKSFLQAATNFEDLSEALEDNEIGRASTLLDELEQVYPGTSFSLYHRGLIARNEGRNDEALKLYEKASEQTPRIGAIWNNIGAIHAAQGHRDEAIAAFHKALGISRSDAVALEGLAQLRYLVRLQADDPQNPNAVAYVDIPTFRKMTSQQLPQIATQPDQLVAFGEQLMREGMVPDVGLQALELAAQARPDHPRTLLALAAAYRVLNQHDKAKATNLRYTELNPQDPSGFYNLAQACNAAQDTAGEKAALERVLELEPNFQPAIAICFGLSPGEHDPAKEDALARWAGEKKSWMAYLLASSLCRERGDAKGALKWAEKAFETNPEAEEVLLHYTATLGDSREFQRLASVIRPIVESGKCSKRLDWNYAQVLKQLGLTNDAITVLKRASSSPDATDELKRMAETVIDAWTGYLAGCGVPLEVHPSGVLVKPVIISLPDGDEGGIVINPGTQLPSEGTFPWRVEGSEGAITLQQGHDTPNVQGQRLGAFKVRGYQLGEGGRATIDCHLLANPDGSMHFRATQGGRKLQVGWTHYTGGKVA
jgi:tetratricopeptide (TPR) repeat protein